MANPVKNTPALYGSAFRRFNRILMSEKNDKASVLEKERIADVVRRVLVKNKYRLPSNLCSGLTNKQHGFTKLFEGICAYFKMYAYIYFMKARLNLTIDETLLSRIKAYSEEKKISISELVEQYFYSISKPTRYQNILDMVEKLNPPKIDVNVDLKKAFYEDQADKYGF